MDLKNKERENEIIQKIMKLSDEKINELIKKFPVNADMASENYILDEKFLIAADLVGSYPLDDLERFLSKL